MPDLHPQPFTRAAIVAKEAANSGSFGQYLKLADNGAAVWIDDPGAATPFPSMREAMRASLRLPGALRAYALPRDVECDVRRHLAA
jgi:hypothetical protein